MSGASEPGGAVGARWPCNYEQLGSARDFHDNDKCVKEDWGVDCFKASLLQRPRRSKVLANTEKKAV